VGCGARPGVQDVESLDEAGVDELGAGPLAFWELVEADTEIEAEDVAGPG
jgi:hypothetical protein